MKLLIKPINGKEFILEGNGYKKDGIFYIGESSFPEQIVEELEEKR